MYYDVKLTRYRNYSSSHVANREEYQSYLRATSELPTSVYRLAIELL